VLLLSSLFGLLFILVWGGGDGQFFQLNIVPKHFYVTCTLYINVFVSFSEISLPNEQSRADILKIHAAPIAKHGEIGKL